MLSPLFTDDFSFFGTCFAGLQSEEPEMWQCDVKLEERREVFGKCFGNFSLES